MFCYRGKKKKGFFIEAGAFDGETISNSLYFELKHQVSVAAIFKLSLKLVKSTKKLISPKIRDL